MRQTESGETVGHAMMVAGNLNECHVVTVTVILSAIRRKQLICATQERLHRISVEGKYEMHDGLCNSARVSESIAETCSEARSGGPAARAWHRIHGTRTDLIWRKQTFWHR